MKGSIIAQGRRTRAIVAARMSIPRPYHYKQPLFINWLLGLTLTPGTTQPIMGFTRPLCILLGHYGSAIMGCTLHLSYNKHLMAIKGNNKHSQLIIKCKIYLSLFDILRYHALMHYRSHHVKTVFI